MTIREAVSRGSSELKASGIETYSLDSSLLLARALNISRSALIANGTDALSEEAHSRYRDFIERRKNGECAAYILGSKEFRGLEFTVNESVLVPRPDTETLVEAALEVLDNNIGLIQKLKFKDNSIYILDLCAGSGAVAVALKHERQELKVAATDISAEALEIAEKNAEKLLGAGKIRFYRGDLFDALPHSTLPDERAYSMIVSNPPYIPSGEIQYLSPEVRGEPRLALDGGESGLEIIERIIESAPAFLISGGTLLLEADPGQMEKITQLMKLKGFINIKLFKDMAGLNRVIGGSVEK